MVAPRRTFSALVLALSFGASSVLAAPTPRASRPPAEADAPAPDIRPVDSGARIVDRVVVRWYAPETGGVAKPQYVFERELAFEARIEAFVDPDPEIAAYRERHVRAALDRHIAETLLASLPIVPPPSPTELAARAAVTRSILVQRVHGAPNLAAAAVAEGIANYEVDAIVARQARASIYLDRMVAPMLVPSELELRDLFRSGALPFKDQPFERVEPLLAQWLVGQRVAQALETYYQNARSRVVVAVSRR